MRIATKKSHNVNPFSKLESIATHKSTSLGLRSRLVASKTACFVVKIKRVAEIKPTSPV